MLYVYVGSRPNQPKKHSNDKHSSKAYLTTWKDLTLQDINTTLIELQQSSQKSEKAVYDCNPALLKFY